jgi:superfamily II DNA or RNA helicase
METREFIEHLNNGNKKIRLWKHQMEALLRVIYWYEILEKKNCLLNIVTGGGKTAIIGATIAWLKSVHKIHKFLILTPNLIVRDRLEADFRDCVVFKKFEFYSSENAVLLNDLGLHVMQSGHQPQGMLDSGILLGNIQQFYSTHITGRRNLAYIMEYIGNIAIFNDEAHNTPAQEYSNVLRVLSEKSRFRLDTTATPNRADGQEPDSEMIYYYDVTKALQDKIIKSIVVYEPEVKLLKLTYTNFETGEKREVTELDAEFRAAEEQVKPFQWILDPEPMKKQMSIALQRHAEQKARANSTYKPILFVVTMSIREAEIAQKMLQEHFNVNTLLVTEESDETERKDALQIGHLDSKYEAVVSVLMLREGWDVPEVSTILLLRKFSSPVYGQQVIGRGLRKIIRDKPEILAVVDHPRLEHDWLWRLVAVSRIRQNVTDEDQFDLEEDLPKMPKIQTLVRPEMLIRIPDPLYDVKINFEKLKDDIPSDEVELNWKDYLDGLNYNRESWMITKTRVDSVRSQRLQDKRLEIIDGPEEGPEGTAAGKLNREELEFKFKNTILDISAGLLREAGFGGLMKGRLYNAMMDHISQKIFAGKRLSEADLTDIEFAMYISPEIRKNFRKPIVAGILGER